MTQLCAGVSQGIYRRWGSFKREVGKKLLKRVFIMSGLVRIWDSFTRRMDFLTVIPPSESPVQKHVNQLLELMPPDGDNHVGGKTGYWTTQLFWFFDPQHNRWDAKRPESFSCEEQTLMSFLFSTDVQKVLWATIAEVDDRTEDTHIFEVALGTQVNRYRPGDTIGWHSHIQNKPGVAYGVIVPLMANDADQGALQVRTGLSKRRVATVPSNVGSMIIMSSTLSHRVLPVKHDRIVVAFDVFVRRKKK